MTNLEILTGALKRELAMPGEFDTVFPNSTDQILTETLADAFAEAQLFGFFRTMTLTGTVVEPDLSAAGGALVTIIAGMRIIRAQIRALNTTERYKAGSVEMETRRSASVLQEELKFLQKRLDDLLDQSRLSGREVHVLDGYVGRLVNYDALGAFSVHEWA